jgi:outer membrane protein assembly factor BamD
MGVNAMQVKSRWKSWTGALLCAFVLSGCGLFSGDKGDPTLGWSAAKLYSEAHDNLTSSNWQEAIRLLDILQTRYPFGRYAQQAQMETAYCQWKDGDSELATSSADRFIKQFPNHPNVDYVYYLRGLINFNDDLGLLSVVTRQDLSERDPKALRESFDAFKELVTRYPDSQYTPDASARMKYLTNALASHEAHVARYYIRRGAYVAALNRAQGIIRDYRQSPSVEEALQISVQAYDGLGLIPLRDDTQRVLDLNYPKVAEIQVTKAWWKFW